MTKKDIQPSEYNEYFGRYINLVSDETQLLQGLENDKKFVTDFFSSIPKEKLEYRYQPKKWTIKEVLQHIIDTERIFMYRFLRIARADKTALMGFEQDDFIFSSEANSKSIDELLQEFMVTRLYTLNLVKSIPTKYLSNMGAASNSPISARACAFILLGHSIWHSNIIKERYL